MAYVSKLTATNGTTYDIKDAEARDMIANLQLHDYLGETTTALTDGSTTNPITIEGASVTATKGATVTYGNKEFLWTGTQWKELGDLSDLGSLAYKNSATGSFTPQGTISGGAVSLTTETVKVVNNAGTLPSATVASGSETMVFSAGALTTTTNKTIVNGGTYTEPTFTGTAGSVTVS